LKDDQKLRALKNLPKAELSRGFDQLRKEYRLRPEFEHFAVRLAPDHRTEAESLMEFGFQVHVSEPSN